jgi:hypothetical protein
MAMQIGSPVLEALSERRLKRVFIDCKATAHMEAFARTLVGLAHWIEHGTEDNALYLGDLARKSLDSATDPKSFDYMDFSKPEQALVEAALIAQALLRAPHQLWEQLPTHVKNNVTNALKSSRVIEPHDNNWVLFPSMIECFLLSIGEHVRDDRLMTGLNLHEAWYVGDGVYGDGEEFHFDYYNSFIIHPMLIEILDVVSKINVEMQEFASSHNKRLQRWAIIQERLIAPDGTFPPVGRSLTYRCGAFHGLGLCAYRKNLHECLKPAQVRVALTRVIRATLDHPGTFSNAWLTKGLYGKQPSLAEPYINHGSLYMCATVFSPLGLSKHDAFWQDRDEKTTWETINMGLDVKRDKPHTECKRKLGRCV